MANEASMKKVYEAWQGDGGCTTAFGPEENIQEQRASGLLPTDAKLLYRVEAETLEEAMAVRHINMGWGPYDPVGEPEKCPKGCSAMFYPEGNGECPNCGRIC
jgi:hypothetical protein